MRSSLTYAVIGVGLFTCFQSRGSETVVFHYDNLRRVIGIAYSSGGSISCSYDKGGNRINFASTAQTIGTDLTQPSIPTGLVTSAISVSQIALSWAPSSDSGGSGLTGYKIVRDGLPIGATSSTNYLDGGLFPNRQYCFTVEAYDNAANKSGPSVQSCAITSTLQQPVLVQALHNLDGGIDFGFDSVPAANYRVQTSTDLIAWTNATNFYGDGSTFIFHGSSFTNAEPFQFFRVISP
jgi:hypothetical protein